MHIFFSVGEPSGDLHGANLIRKLKQRDPGAKCTGFGGPRMREAGCALDEDLTQLAVMWFVTALLQIRRFWVLYRHAKRVFREQQPDAVVLIDYPGFNWWVARAAKQQGIPVYYYGVPQMWAWASWRIKKMRRLIDHALCKLPFEAEWYQQRGCDAKYIGHPYFDEVAERQLDEAFLRGQAQGHSSHWPSDSGGPPSSPLVTLLPGSRKQEVERNGPELLRAALKAWRQHPQMRFAVACFNEVQREIMAQHLDALQNELDGRLPVELHVNRTPELIEAAKCCLACSGSVSLELMCAAKPSAIVYRMSRMQYALGKRLVKVRYMTLVNLLAMEDRFEPADEPYDPLRPGAEQVPMPEYPTYEDRSDALASHLVAWTTDPAAYQAAQRRLMDLREQFANPGASARAADYIFETLRPSTVGSQASPARKDAA